MATYNAIPPSAEGLDPYSPALGRQLAAPSDDYMTQMENRIGLRALARGGQQRYLDALTAAQLSQREGQKAADASERAGKIIDAIGSIGHDTGVGYRILDLHDPNATADTGTEATRLDKGGGDVQNAKGFNLRATGLSDLASKAGYIPSASDVGSLLTGDQKYPFAPYLPPAETASEANAKVAADARIRAAELHAPGDGSSVTQIYTGVPGAPVQTMVKTRGGGSGYIPPAQQQPQTGGAPAPAPDAAPRQANNRGGAAPPLYQSQGLEKRVGPDGQPHWYPKT